MTIDEVGAGLRPAFGDRLWEAMRSHGPVCVGIDPHPGLVESWGLPLTVEGLRSFSLGVVDALGGRVAAFKPQSAFFERFGSGGIAVLEEVIAASRQAGSLCIVDAKRGDIGSTMHGYAHAYLEDGSPLASDAVTLSPFLGLGSLKPALEVAQRTGRGVFVLGLTSNPEGPEIQHARSDDGISVARGLVEGVAEINRLSDVRHMGSWGMVIGATVGDAVTQLGINLHHMGGPILAPGFGAQGAGSQQVSQVFAGVEDRVLASTSRAVLAGGPTPQGLREAHAQAVDQLESVLTSVGNPPRV